MVETIENQQSAASPGAASSEAETLLEFLYLTPVGIVKFRLDGAIDIANPVAAALLMPLARIRRCLICIVCCRRWRRICGIG
jgi:hypothetical protein